MFGLKKKKAQVNGVTRYTTKLSGSLGMGSYQLALNCRIETPSSPSGGHVKCKQAPQKNNSFLRLTLQPLAIPFSKKKKSRSVRITSLIHSDFCYFLMMLPKSYKYSFSLRSGIPRPTSFQR